MWRSSYCGHFSAPGDTDGDGITDEIDLDDDNDGILDTDEGRYSNSNSTSLTNGSLEDEVNNGMGPGAPWTTSGTPDVNDATAPQIGGNGSIGEEAKPSDGGTFVGLGVEQIRQVVTLTYNTTYVLCFEQANFGAYTNTNLDYINDGNVEVTLRYHGLSYSRW